MQLAGAIFKLKLEKKVHSEKTFRVFREMELSSSNIKKSYFSFSYISGTETPKRVPYISGNENPGKLLMFQEVTFQARKIKKTRSENTSYISKNGTF